jgi:hypothetical protein
MSLCKVSNSNCYGGNQVVQDTTGNTGDFVTGDEVDVNLNGTAQTRATGVYINGQFSSAPRGAYAIQIANAITANQWNIGVLCRDGAMLGPCLQVGATSTGKNVGSQELSFVGRDAGGTQHNAVLNGTSGGSLNLIIPSGQQFSMQIGSFSGAFTHSNTANHTYTLPDTSITISGAIAQDCGTTTACSATNISATVKIVKGSVALNSGMPSKATVKGFNPAFTSSTSYVCTVSNATTQANPLKVVNTSASSITITGPNTVTDTANYICVGN